MGGFADLSKVSVAQRQASALGGSADLKQLARREEGRRLWLDILDLKLDG
ncbi:MULTISPECIES: hypothetical protein [unclassified Anabaena]|nr:MULTISPECIES: hypothetical protein [unclassified Anabaena]